jgi:WD40 repeat protein
MTEAAEGQKTKRVFISYAWKDSRELADLLYENLKGQCIPWKDDKRMAGGMNWSTEIEREIDATDVVVALVSPAANSSVVCRCERMRARRKLKLVIPILAVSGTDLPLELEGTIFRDFTGANFAQGFGLLLEDILQPHGRVELPACLKQTYVTAPALPFNYIERADVLANLQEALFIDPARPSIAMTALHGMGGAGKTVLALGLVSNEVIQQAFPDGIVWVDIGEKSKNDLTARIREVGKALGDNPANYDGELSAKNAYRSLMRNKAALIVLDDVWRASDIEPFRVDSPRSRLLFTTRDVSLAGSMGARLIESGFLSHDESRQMLAEYIDLSIQNLPPIADDILGECGGLSLGIAIIGAMLFATKGDSRSWQRILQLLKAADLERIELQFSNYPHPNLLRALQVSVEALDPSTRERYLALAVVHENLPIDPVVQQVLWNADQSGARGTAEKLVRLALAQWAEKNGSIRLHDLLFDYVRAQFPDRDSLGLIHEAMQLSAHVVERDPTQFPSQLVGRLLPYIKKEAVGSFVEHVRGWSGAPWLQPLTEALTSPGTTLVASLDEPGGGIQIVAVSDSGDTVALAVHDDRNQIAPAVRVWRVGLETRTLPVSGNVSALAVSPDALRLAIALTSPARSISICSLAGLTEPLYSLPVDDGGIVALTFVDANHLAAVTEQAKLQTWFLGSHTPLLTESAPISGKWLNGTTSVVLSYQAKKLFTHCGKGVKEWHFDGGSGCAIEAPGFQLRAFAATPDARTLVLGDLKIEIWSRHGDGFRLTGTLPDHGFNLVGLAVTADGMRVVSSTYSQIKIWHLGSQRPNPKDGRAEKYIRRLEMRADGKEALAKCQDGTWKFIDVASRTELQTTESPADSRWLATSYNGSNYIVGSGKDLLVADAHTKRIRRSIVSPVEGIPVAVTADFRKAISWLAPPKPETKRGGVYAVWDIETGAILAQTKDAIENTPIVLFPDGARMATGNWRSVQILDLHSGDLLRTLVGPTHYVDCLAVADTPYGLRIAAGSRDRIVRLWALEHNEPILTLAGHTYTISDVQFLPGNERLMSASGDNTLRVWNVASGQCEAVFTADAWILCCAPTPDGKIVLAGDMAGNLHFLEFCHPNLN